MNIEWSIKYNVNIDLIDDQHKTFFSLIRSLNTTEEVSEESSIVREILRYANIHFVSEETLMEKHGYKELDQQKKMHKDLLFELNNHVKPSGTFISSKNTFIDFLLNWFVDHTLMEDKKFGDFYNALELENQKSAG